MQFQERSTIHKPHDRRHRRPPQPWYKRVGETLTSERSRFAAIVVFVLLVGMTGGSSRSDALGVLAIRPAAVFFAAYALIVLTRGQLREVKIPLATISVFAALALLQLLPLPWAIWTALPQREGVKELSALLGMADISRPLSLDPNRTWNFFFALSVPFATICLCAIQSDRFRRLLVPLLAMVAILSGAVGFLQAIGGEGLQPYRITHRGYPTGLFANKNHQSVMLLWVMLATSWLAAGVNPRKRSAGFAVAGAVAAILVLFPLIVLTGSRAGLLLSAPILLLCGWLLLRAPATTDVLRRAGRRAKVWVGVTVLLMAAPLLFVFGTLALSGRRTALSRLFEAEAAEELRWQYLSLIQQMAVDYLPFGSGFGSFERVFDAYEPAEMLTSRYMNQAHNDLMQLAIEGGAPALLVVILAFGWLVYALWQIGRLGRAGRLAAVFLGGSIALWSAASLVDYPLRAPLASLVFAALTALIGMLSSGSRWSQSQLRKHAEEI